MAPLRVGFLGLGLMGGPIARRILEAGHDVVVWNRSPEKAESLREAGAGVASSVAEACAGREVVASMVADDKALLEVAAQVRDALEPGAIHLMMGTHGVQAVREATELHRAAGQVAVAAPVLGRPEVAEAGQLGIVAAGPAEAVETCEPIFEAVGRRTFRAGEEPVGASAVKLANNFALGCAIEAMAESFALVEAYGIDPQTMYEIFTEGLFAGSVAYSGYGKAMLEGRFEPGMKVVLALKDVDLILAAAAEAGVELPSAQVSRATLAETIERGEGERDWAVIVHTRRGE